MKYINSICIGIYLTYRCNLSCDRCYQLANRILWIDSDISLDDLLIGSHVLKKHNLSTHGTIRVIGGEPTLHPDLVSCVRIIKDEWISEKSHAVLCTNGTVKFDEKSVGLRIRYSKPGPRKFQDQRTVLISPFDLGYVPVLGSFNVCDLARRCGRVFDTYGFTFCPYAGTLGQILRIDPYHKSPILMGFPEFCQHCVWSLSNKDRQYIYSLVQAGKVEYPSKSYKEGLARLHGTPFKFRKFQERLNDN